MKTREQISYEENINSFVKTLNGQVLKRLTFFLDLEPTFDISKIPFSFNYARQLIIHSDKANYYLQTTQTSSAIETFWVSADSFDKNEQPDLTLEINEVIQNIKTEKGLDDYCYKIILTTQKNTWTFMSADFYDTNDGTVDFKINDEMIIATVDSKNLELYERNR